MKLVGYARVSTEDQNLALQHDALRAAGCESVHDDRGISGVTTDRPGLAAAIAACASGDVLVVWKLDRLGRSTLELLGLVQDLDRRGIGLKVLTGAGASIDTTRPEGRMILAVFAAMAEFEHDLNRERTRAGMAAAKRRGRHVGRPPKLTPHDVDIARQLIDSGRERAEVAATLKVGVSTLRRALRPVRAMTGQGRHG
jgi:DNA invertase Pin-like site-specific DNA recombinase